MEHAGSAARVRVHVVCSAQHYVTVLDITVHHSTLHYITVHYGTSQYITLHYITVHHMTSRYSVHRCYIQNGTVLLKITDSSLRKDWRN
jgi:hypothetical protein